MSTPAGLHTYIQQIVREIVEGELSRGLGGADPPATNNPIRTQGALITPVGHDILDVAGQWLGSARATLDETTVRQYRMYAGSHWLPFFRTVEAVTEASVSEYTAQRLRTVRRGSVEKELAALRVFADWLVLHGQIERAPTIASLSRHVTGTPDESRHHKLKAIPLAPEEAEAWIAALPEWSTGYHHGVGRFPVRDRIRVAWETGARPETLDEIRAPDDYHRGAEVLIIRDEADKARFGRELPLTVAAREALDRRCPDVGLIFGPRDYRTYLRAAARAALSPEKCERVSVYDLRHARLNMLVDRGGSLTGVAFLAGHKQVTTTNRYVKAQRRAAVEIIRAADDAQRTVRQNNAPVSDGTTSHSDVRHQR